MKKIVIIILVMISNLMSAQDLPVLSTTSLANPEYGGLEHAKKGNYAMDTTNERQQYVGLWRYNENGILFELKIELKNQHLSKIEYQGTVLDYDYYDIVTLRYKLVKNNVVLYNNLDLPYQVESYNSYGIKEANRDLYGKIMDHHRQVWGSYTIKKLVGTPEKIIFNLGEFNYHILGDSSMYQPGVKLFSIPTGGIEMVKVE